MKVLITGGIGYIGSHTVVEMSKNNDYEIVIIDNLVNSKIEIKDNIEKITAKKVNFYKTDLLEIDSLREIFRKENFDLVIHFAALKSVAESVSEPLRYYNNNLTGTINLLMVMKEFNVKNIIFSSSATVYGDSKIMPVHEELPLLPAANPYGRTKSMMEDVLKDVYKSDDSWNVIILRYFNPVGAHESGLIGELPNGIPNNLLPYVSMVADRKLEYLNVFGDDYDTVDGTGVRDYIHVVDLAKGHVSAIEKLKENCGLKIYNLGTGMGYSVLEVVKAFEKASNKEVPYKLVDRRKGDVATCYSDPTLAEKELGWKAEKNLNNMCEDFWRWQLLGLAQLRKEF